MQTTFALAMVVKPFAALFVFGCICLPIKIAFQKWFPEGRIKRILLRPLYSKKPPR